VSLSLKQPTNTQLGLGSFRPRFRKMGLRIMSGRSIPSDVATHYAPTERGSHYAKRL